MRVLVTGAFGFVGRRLLPFLESAGHLVRGVGQEVDVRDAPALARVVAESAPEAVIHLAAMSHVGESWQNPDACFAINTQGTQNLLDAVMDEASAARVLLIGSADQYSASEPRDLPLDEHTPLNPKSPYGQSKAQAEALGLKARDAGLDVVCVRAFNHTGAGQADTFVASSFARQVARIALGLEPPLMRVGNLASVRDFLHVDDVVRAYGLLLSPDVPAAIYNVAGERATPIQKVLDRLLEIAEISPRIERDPDRFRPTDWLVGDAARLRKAAGWRPSIALEAILQELYADWRTLESTASRDTPGKK